MFPLRSALIAVAAGCFLWLIGFPTWAAILFCFLGFLKKGGLQFFRLAYLAIPRDLWMLKNFKAAMDDINHGLKNNLTLTDRFKVTAEKYPDKVAILYQDTKITFRKLNEVSNRIANALRSSTSLQRGDTMAIFMKENCPEYIFVFLALSKLGVTASFINYYLRAESLAHCIRVANCSGLFFASSLSDAVSKVLPDLSISDMLYCVGEGCSLPQAKSLEAMIEAADSSDLPPVEGKTAQDKLCCIYTSGTTGLPKACTIKNSRFYLFARIYAQLGGVRPVDVIYLTTPLYHTTGSTVLGQVLVFGTTVAMRGKFSASNFWTDCVKYRCTVFFYIGELCRYLLAQPKNPADTQHCLRLMIGSGLRAQIWSEFTKRFHIPKVVEAFGSTEGNVGFFNPFNKIGACGYFPNFIPIPNPSFLLKVEPGTGAYVRDRRGFCVVAGVNEPGEAVGRIVNKNFDGYTDQNATKKKVMCDVFAPGDQFFLSGDILRRDEEGFYYFCDRTGDTFRWKGENVSTTEVEGIMAGILQLRDVVVYGVEVPGNEGRAGMAAIAGGSTGESVDLTGLAQQLFLSLPAYAVPLFVRLIPEADLTGTFKLKKVALRNEGFDVSLSDPLFILDTARKVYQPLTEEIYEQLQNGTIRI